MLPAIALLVSGFSLIPAPAWALGEHITGDLTGNTVWGCGFTPGHSVSVVVLPSEGGTPAFTGTPLINDAGCFNEMLNDANPPVDLVPGMFITVTDGTAGVTRNLTLANLTIDTINVDTNTVSGHAPDGTVNVNAFMGGPPVGGQATAAGGIWDYTFTVNIILTTNVNASVNDDNGDSTSVNRKAFGGWFNADLAHDQIGGYGFTPNTNVTVAVTGGDATPFNTVLGTDANGNFGFDTQLGIDLKDGMVITVTDNPPVGTVYSKVLTLVDLGIDTIDVVNNIVSGHAPAGVTVNVGTDVSQVPVQETANTAGNWSHDFDLDSTPVDITVRTNVNASVNDADGDSTGFSLRLFGGQVWADLSNDQIGGNGFTAGSTVSVKVNGTELTTHPTADSEGNFWFDTEPGYLEPGMVITVTDVATAYFKELTLVTLTIGTIDVATEIVSGHAPAGAQVNLGADVGGGVGSQVTAEADGSWFFDFSPANITPSTNVNASVGDEDGDSTNVNRRLFEGQVWADLSNDQIGGNGFTANSTVTVKVDAVELTTHPTADPEGNFGFDTEPGYLEPGMVITVTDTATGYFKELTLVTLTIAINVADDTVSGTAPADAQVNVGADVGGEWVGGQTTASALGVWSFPFPSAVDITPGTNVNASVNDEDGDSTNVNRRLFEGQVWADLTNDQISGNGFTPSTNETSNTVTVKVDGTELTTHPTTDSAGNFGFDTELGIDLVPGMDITVTDQTTGFAKDLTLANLSIETINVTTDTVSGTADPGTQVNVGADVGEGVGGQTTASDLGVWSFTFPDGVDITPSTEVNASVNDGDGDSTGVNLRLFNGWLYANLTDDQIQGDRFSPNATVTMQVTTSDGTVLRSKRVTTDANGTFWFGPLTSSLTNLEPGMHVIATDRATGYALDLKLDPVTFNVFDTESGVASGTGPPNSWVNVSIQNPLAPPAEPEQVDINTQTDGVGDWMVDFPRSFASTAWASASVGSMAGGTGVNFKRPHISGNLTDDAVSGTDLAEAASVTVKILASGGAQLYSGTITTDGSGWFTVAQRVHHVDLVPGMQIVINAETDTERTLTLVNLTITSATLDPFTVSGTAFTAGTSGTSLEGSTVTAGFKRYRIEAGDAASTTVNPDGTWSVVTSFIPEPRSSVFAWASETDGDTTGVNWVAPKPGKN